MRNTKINFLKACLSFLLFFFFFRKQQLMEQEYNHQSRLEEERSKRDQEGRRQDAQMKVSSFFFLSFKFPRKIATKNDNIVWLFFLHQLFLKLFFFLSLLRFWKNWRSCLLGKRQTKAYSRLGNCIVFSTSDVKNSFLKIEFICFLLTLLFFWLRACSWEKMSSGVFWLHLTTKKCFGKKLLTGITDFMRKNVFLTACTKAKKCIQLTVSPSPDIGSSVRCEPSVPCANCAICVFPTPGTWAVLYHENHRQYYFNLVLFF